MNASDAPPRHAHRRRWIVVIAAASVLAILACIFVILWRRSGAHEVSIEDARRRFSASSSTQPASPSRLRPAAGVYVYEGSGSEHLSLPPKTARQGPRMPGTVTQTADGCWTFRIDYSSQHWQTWNYCPRAGGLVELGGQTFERWDFVITTYDSTSTFTCSPPAIAIRAVMHPGDRWQQSCRGTSTGTTGEAVSSGSYSLVGNDTVTVGNAKVPAYHFRQERTMSGSQRGTQKTDLWFARRNGLPLRNVRTQTVHTDTVIGSSTYTEHGSFRLTSLQPRT